MKNCPATVNDERLHTFSNNSGVIEIAPALGADDGGSDRMRDAISMVESDESSCLMQLADIFCFRNRFRLLAFLVFRPLKMWRCEARVLQAEGGRGKGEGGKGVTV